MENTPRLYDTLEVKAIRTKAAQTLGSGGLPGGNNQDTAGLKLSRYSGFL